MGNFRYIWAISIFILLAFSSIASSQTWENTNLPTVRAITAIAINSVDDIFVGTHGGMYFADMYRSTDKGNNWVNISNGLTTSCVNAIAINTSGNIFAGCDNGIFLSTDNGDNWIKISSYPEDHVIKSLAINSTDDIFAGEQGGGVYRSTDNGEIWIEINNGLTETHIHTIAINPADEIFVGTYFGVFYSTDNGGHWIESITKEYLEIRDIAVGSSDEIFAAAYGDGILRSTDNGDTWDEMLNDLTNTYFNAIEINSSGDVFAGCNFGAYRSTDNGNIWVEINNGLSDEYLTVFAINSADDIFAGTFDGDVFRLSHQTNIIFENNPEILPSEYSISQNRPNPFNISTEIDFSLPRASHVNLDIYNLLGQKIATVVSGDIEAGNYNIAWDAAREASGIYFYRLEAGDFAETKKMLLLK